MIAESPSPYMVPTPQDPYIRSILEDQEKILARLDQTEKGMLLKQGIEATNEAERLLNLERELQLPTVSNEVLAEVTQYIFIQEELIRESMQSDSDNKRNQTLLGKWRHIRNKIKARDFRAISFCLKEDAKQYSLRAEEILKDTEKLVDPEYEKLEEEMKMNLIHIYGLRSLSEDKKVRKWAEGEPKSLHLEDVFMNIPFTLKRALPESVVSLELGSIGKDCDDLMGLTRLDLKREDKKVHEWGRQYYTAYNGEIIRENARRGEESQINSRWKLKQIRYPEQMKATKRFLTDRCPIVHLHSHGLYLEPPSPQDLLLLLSTNGLLVESAVMVVNPISENDQEGSNKTLVFRTDKTPDFTQENLETSINEWIEDLKIGTTEEEFTAKIQEMIGEDTNGELAKVLIRYQKTANQTESDMVFKELAYIFEWNLLKKYAKKWNLKIFKTQNGENIARQVDLN